MTNRTQSRRRFLAGTTGLAISLGIAGCLTDPRAGTGGESPTPHDDDECHDGADCGEQGGHEDGHDEPTDDGHDHDEGTPEEPSPAATVTMRTEGHEQHFAPHVTWVEVGGTVTWENESGQHNAVAYHPDNHDKPRRMPEAAEAWETALLDDEGATASHTFETAGVYDYYCAPHESAGMVGTVIVGEPDAHEQPGLEAPQQDLPDGARAELAELNEKVDEALGHTE